MKIVLPVRKAILRRRTFEAPSEDRVKKLRLDFNENTSGCGKAVLRALRKISPAELAMYPEYAGPGRRLTAHFGVADDELLLTNGGDDALRVFFDTFVEFGARILICEPTFPMYRYYAEIAGARVDSVRYDAQMGFPMDAFLSALRKRPRVAFIANPNNPTGTLISRVAIEKILRAATHTAVVIDEAYAEFSGLTVVDLIGKYRNLFVARTFSKAAGLAGLRLGAVLAKRESLTYLRRAMPPFPVNVAALRAAVAAVNDRATVGRYISRTTKAREGFAKQLQAFGIKTYPSSGNFLLADFGGRGPAVFVKLAKDGILVRDRPDIGEGFARITIGTQSEMRRVVTAIRIAMLGR